MEISQKSLGEGAKDVLAKVSQESFAPPKPCFVPVQPFFAPVQDDFGTLGPKHLLHPLLTTFGKFPFSGPLPEPWGRKIREQKINANFFCTKFFEQV